MSSIPISDNYPTEPSRLSFYPGTCHTVIGGDLWRRHLKTIEILENQAEKLGLFIVAFEFALLRANHIAAQLKAELEK